MTDRGTLLQLIRRHGLDALPRASKDNLETQAAHFAEAVRGYAASSASAIAAGNIELSDQAYDRYRLAAILYAPGLIEELASSLVELAATNE
jgi:hypothetical protein